MKIDYFYHLDYCLHFYCYIYNVSADAYVIIVFHNVNKFMRFIGPKNSL